MVARNPAQTFLENFRPSQTIDIKTFIEAYAQQLLMEAETYCFPVSLPKILAHYDLVVHQAPLARQRGAITEDYQIIVNSLDKGQVQTYTQAHELIEILFAEILINEPDYLSEAQITELHDRKEHWCEIGAAEILMPLRYFRAAIQDTDFSIQTAKSVAESSGLSLFPVLRRMVETGLRKCVLVVWEYTYKPKDFKRNQLSLGEEFDPPKELRVARAYKSPSLTNHIMIHKSVGMDTTIGRTYQEAGNKIFRGYDYVEICSIKGYFRTESIHVKYDGISRVWSIVFYDDEVDSQYVIN